MRWPFLLGGTRFGIVVLHDRGELVHGTPQRIEFSLLIEQHFAQLVDVVLQVHQEQLDLHQTLVVGAIVGHGVLNLTIRDQPAHVLSVECV